MDTNKKNTFLWAALGAVSLAALCNTEPLTDLLKKIFDIVFPVLLGLAFAFLLNIPMGRFEGLLHKISKGRIGKAGVPLSFLLSICSVTSVFYSVSRLIVPTLRSSLTGLYLRLCDKLPEWTERLSVYGIDSRSIYELISDMEPSKFLTFVAGGAGNVFSSVWRMLFSAVSGAADIAVALVIMVYTLLSKRTLKRQAKRAVFAFFGEKRANRAFHIGAIIYDTYAKFFSGACAEALVLGAVMFFALTVCRVPYSALIGVICAVFSFVQYIGGACSCTLGALLVALAAPNKIIVFFIVFGAVQFAENQFIYPNVVGSSVGLGGLWTVIAAVIGGGVLGIAGMVLFIPLFAVIKQLVCERIHKLEESRLRNMTENKKS